MIGLLLTWLTVGGLVAIGCGAILAPGLSAAQYGIVLDDPRASAFIRAMGARDFVLGVLLGLLALASRHDLLAWGLGASALIAGVDFLVVAADRHPGSQRARLLHAGGTVGLLAAASIVALGF